MRPHRHLRRRRQRRRLLSKRLAQTGYRGHRCARPHEPVVELDCTRAPPDARAFFDAFVRRRRPCVLRGYARTAALGAVSDACGAADPARAWCAALDRAAGPKVVRAEVRERGRFGRGHECQLRVRGFVAEALHRHATGGACRYYLTTQPLAEDAEGRPELCGEPVRSLVRAHRFPPTCPLLPSLILANANVWMGCAPAGRSTSSGLHHDFHDNVLVQVCGAKRVRMWDPSATNVLRPAGGRARVHANGRVVYGGAAVEADGRDAAAATSLDLHRALDDASDSDDCDALLDAALALEANHEKEPATPLAPGPPNFATRRAPRGLPSYGACYIGPGDALYIPCGVWHEVSSGGGLHAAANYWCHPPDGASFARPYTSSFWADDWARRRRDDPLLET